mmetsp:Transcript_721/g.2337  ORF Transcript_721/g.2337 Transcript_721/m.2337 type:complete len:440 (-) Transcript_721:246-1565(-)
MAWIAPTVAISVSSSLDNLTIGCGYGIKGVRIGIPHNATVALINTLGMYAMMVCGKLVVQFLPPSLAGMAAGIVFLLLGVWEMARLFNLWRTGRLHEKPKDGNIDWSVDELPQEPGEALDDGKAGDDDGKFCDDVPAFDEEPADATAAPESAAPDVATAQAGEPAQKGDRRAYGSFSSSMDGEDAAFGGSCFGEAPSYEAGDARPGVQRSTSFMALLGLEAAPAADVGGVEITVRAPADEEAPRCAAADVHVATPMPPMRPRPPPPMRAMSALGLGNRSATRRNADVLGWFTKLWHSARAQSGSVGADAGPVAAFARGDEADEEVKEGEDGELPTAVRVPDSASDGLTALCMRDAVILGVALTMSNLAAGLAAGIAGFDKTQTCTVTFLASFILMQAGQFAGRAVRNQATTRFRLGENEISALSGCIFMGIGLSMITSG